MQIPVQIANAIGPEPVQIIQPVQIVRPEVKQPTIVEIVKKKKRRFPKIKKPTKREFTCKTCLKIAAIIAAIILAAGAIAGLLMTGLLVFQHHLFYPTVSYTTTTKVSGSLTYNVGQLCQWNNQCPMNAYCSGTCRCSDNSYWDSTTGACRSGLKIKDLF